MQYKSYMITKEELFNAIDVTIKELDEEITSTDSINAFKKLKTNIALQTHKPEHDVKMGEYFAIQQKKSIKINDIVEGSIIRNKGSGEAYVVIQNRGDGLIVSRSLQVHNPSEWELMYANIEVIKPLAIMS